MEGIGDSFSGPISSLFMNGTNDEGIIILRRRTLSVFDGDECIFTEEHFAWALWTGIQNIENNMGKEIKKPDYAPKANSRKIYCLQGQLLKRQPFSGVYIKNRKKVLR